MDTSSSSMSSIFKVDTSQDCFACIVRFIAWFVIVCCIGCLFSSLLSGSSSSCNSGMAYKPVQFEGFSNDTLFSTKKEASAAFASAQLNAALDKDGTPSNLMVGEARRHIYKPHTQTDGLVARFVLWADLYQLNGDVFNPSINQSYKAYLLGADKSKIYLGELKHGSDNWYKLDVQRQDINQVTSKRWIYISYEKDGQENILLSGQFA